MAAQFFSSFADNALLIAAIALLIENHADDWVHPLLKLFFVFSYVVLAPFVGAFADSMPKGRVMFITNTIKIFGCILLFATIHPLLSYAVIGFGAAAYSPAKYGILTELLPPEKLVVANGWIETLTVSSIILGTVVGGLLISPHISTILIDIVSPLGIHSKADAAILVITGFYLLAALFNLRIPDTGFRYPPQEHGAIRLIKDFRHCCFTLWRDKLGQISLALTTLLWGAGATFQFIILEWAKNALNMPLNQAAVLQGVFALGIAVGAICAARYIPLKKSLSVMPAGILMAAFVMCMPLVHNVWLPVIL